MTRLMSAVAVGAAAATVAFATPAFATCDSPAEAANKKVVLDFYDKAINQKDYEAAKVYFGSGYTQHNPGAGDGPEGLKGFIGFLKAKMPQYHNTFKATYCDGDFVIVHVHSQKDPSDRGRAIVDIFRLENGKVVEHWDVAQAIPAKPKNDNTMFYK
jgi:predicted SnoaL-like aldol condensation-catalyzing enzyme